MNACTDAKPTDVLVEALRNIQLHGDIKPGTERDTPSETLLRARTEREGYAVLDYALGGLRLTELGHRKLASGPEERTGKVVHVAFRRPSPPAPRKPRNR